jgi:hypothetical protein
VTAQVTIPGENSNNARSVNFSNIYHQGGCVPVPVCPTGMIAEIFVVPVSVAGTNDVASNGSGNGNQGVSPQTVYPLMSFTAFATPSAGAAGPGNGGPGGGNTPPTCDAAATDTTCYSDVSGGLGVSSGDYWRACMQVVTQKGDVSVTNTASGSGAWGYNVDILAITRCSPAAEPSGSGIGVFTQ